MTAIRAAGHDTTVKIQSLLIRRLSHLKPPDAATTVVGTPSRSLTISSTHRSRRLLHAYLIREEKP